MKAKLAALVLAGSLLGGASTASAGLFGWVYLFFVGF